MQTPRIYSIIGYPGSGKTYCGKILADKIGYNFVDLDEVIKKQSGITIREHYERYGEKSFRALETLTLANELIQAERPMVLSTGGGVVLEKINREYLREYSTVLHLYSPPSMCWIRIEQSEPRPGFEGMNRIEFCNEIAKRFHLYVWTRHKFVVPGTLIRGEI